MTTTVEPCRRDVLFFFSFLEYAGERRDVLCLCCIFFFRLCPFLGVKLWRLVFPLGCSLVGDLISHIYDIFVYVNLKSACACVLVCQGMCFGSSFITFSMMESK
jgi:formate hydrogenlyase subunit 4